MPAFVLLVRPRDDSDPAIGIGFTVSRKVGNAVVRNRMKRRLRALTRAVLPEAGLPGADHVLIGRGSGIERDFALLDAELRKALVKAASPATARDTGHPRESRPSTQSRHSGGSRNPGQ
jgi:ribonuclease P protein component